MGMSRGVGAEARGRVGAGQRAGQGRAGQGRAGQPLDLRAKGYSLVVKNLGHFKHLYSSIIFHALS